MHHRGGGGSRGVRGPAPLMVFDADQNAEAAQRLAWLNVIMRCVHEMRQQGWGWPTASQDSFARISGVDMIGGLADNADAGAMVHPLADRQVEISIGPVELSLLHTSAVTRLVLPMGVQVRQHEYSAAHFSVNETFTQVSCCIFRLMHHL